MKKKQSVVENSRTHSHQQGYGPVAFCYSTFLLYPTASFTPARFYVQVLSSQHFSYRAFHATFKTAALRLIMYSSSWTCIYHIYHGAFRSLETWQFCTEHKGERSVNFNGSASTALCKHILHRWKRTAKATRRA